MGACIGASGTLFAFKPALEDHEEGLDPGPAYKPPCSRPAERPAKRGIMPLACEQGGSACDRPPEQFGIVSCALLFQPGAFLLFDIVPAFGQLADKSISTLPTSKHKP